MNLTTFQFVNNKNSPSTIQFIIEELDKNNPKDFKELAIYKIESILINLGYKKELCNIQFKELLVEENTLMGFCSLTNLD